MESLPVTTHPSAPKDRTPDWAQGVSFLDFLPTAEKNADLWRGVYLRAVLPPEIVERASAVPGAWRLLVLSADWCGDASNTVPVLARLAEAVPSLELRLLERDEHLPLMDEHLTGGRSRSIPAVLLLDGDGVERAWWGPRPAALQAWMMREGLAMEPPDRYREARRWYARDKGLATLAEIVAMLEVQARALPSAR